MNGESQMILAGNLGASGSTGRWRESTTIPMPGLQARRFAPRPVGDLTFVNGSHKSQYGTIVSRWKIKGDRFHWQVIIPPNTTATVYVPTRDAAAVTEGGKPAAEADGLRFLRGVRGGRVQRRRPAPMRLPRRGASQAGNLKKKALIERPCLLETYLRLVEPLDDDRVPPSARD